MYIWKLKSLGSETYKEFSPIWMSNGIFRNQEDPRMIFHCAELSRCTEGHLVSLFTLHANWRPVASSNHWDNQKQPLHFPMLSIRGSTVRIEKQRYCIMRKQYGGPKGSMFSGLLCFPAWHPICVLQNVNPRHVLQSSPDRSPAQTRSLDCSTSRTSNTAGSASFPSNPWHPGFNVTNVFSWVGEEICIY